MKTPNKTILDGRIASIGLIVFFLAGCAAASGVSFSERTTSPAEKSLIYIYQEDRTLGSANSWAFFVNGRPVTDITNGGYYDFVVEPGPVEFEYETNISIIGAGTAALDRYLSGRVPIYMFQAAPNRVYYLKFSATSSDRFSEVTREQAVK